MDNHYNYQAPQPLLKKATVWQRLGAFLVDHFILTAVTAVLYAFVSTIFMLLGLRNPDISEEIWILLVALFFIVIIFFVYGLRDVYKGQSVGKLALGIGVRELTDNFAVPPVSKLFLRQIFSFMWPVEFLVLIISRDGQKIGDKIAGTCVYNLREYEQRAYQARHMEYKNQWQKAIPWYEQPPSVPSCENQPFSSGERSSLLQAEPHAHPFAQPSYALPHKPKRAKTAMLIIVLMLAGLVFFGSILFGVFSIIRNHPAHHAATDYIRASDEIAAAIGEINRFGFFTTGSINTSAGGRGTAELTIRVIGSEDEARVFVQLERHPLGDWQVVNFDRR